jgi:hypothetical protein
MAQQQQRLPGPAAKRLLVIAYTWLYIIRDLLLRGTWCPRPCGRQYSLRYRGCTP